MTFAGCVEGPATNYPLSLPLRGAVTVCVEDALRTKSDHAGSIEVGTLQQILMVDYGQLKPVIMKVAWVPQLVEGQSAVKRDRHGFWMCKLGVVDNSATRNLCVS